jgi:hypothetical protein
MVLPEFALDVFAFPANVIPAGTVARLTPLNVVIDAAIVSVLAKAVPGVKINPAAALPERATVVPERVKVPFDALAGEIDVRTPNPNEATATSAIRL